MARSVKSEAGIAGLLRRLGGPKATRRSASEHPPVRAAPSEPEIRRWLAGRLGELTEIPHEEIDPAEPFSSYGLGSREGLALSGKLEEWLGMKLPPSLVWEFPTIDQVAAFLVDPERVRQHAAQELDPSLLDE